MLLQNLEISNFKAFKSVQLNDLGRVNLLVGKNNCGKTSVLEALRVFAGNGSLQSFLELAAEREDTGPQGFLEDDGELKALVVGLFKDYDFENNSKIVIGDTKQDKTVTIEYATYVSYEDEKNNNFRIKNPSEKKLNEISEMGAKIEFWDGILITNPSQGRASFRFDNDSQTNLMLGGFKKEKITIPLFVVRAKSNHDEEFASLMDEVSLDDAKKQQVITALNVVEPRIKNVSFIATESVSSIIGKIIGKKSTSYKKRIPFARIEHSDLNIPLKSMGDGVHRILDIVLHLVSAKNGILLIDEFENGLHYAVQEKLWQLIFKVATELDVQVFVTTHSADCVRAFSHAAKDHPEKSVLIHMKKNEDTGDIEAITIDENALENLLAADIEVR